MTALSLRIVGIDPSAVIEHNPERISIDHRQIGNNGDKDVLHSLVVKGPSEVMMIDDVMAPIGSEHHRNHMLA